MTNLNIVLGRVFGAVTRSAKLRAALAAVVVAAFARLGMNVDDETAVALLLLAGTLAGWGPTGEKAG